jgi:predicted nucleotidyltransferase
MNPWLKDHRDEILSAARKYGARNVRVFGSMLREDYRQKSDVDLLVEFEAGRSLLDLVGMRIDLHDALGRSFDIVTEKSLHRLIRDRVLREAVQL